MASSSGPAFPSHSPRLTPLSIMNNSPPFDDSFSSTGRPAKISRRESYRRSVTTINNPSSGPIPPIPEDAILDSSAISPFSTTTTSSASTYLTASSPSTSPLGHVSRTPSGNAAYDIKSALTDLLNCEAVRADANMRLWVQSRLMEAELELKRQRRRRVSGACGAHGSSTALIPPLNASPTGQWTR